GAWLGGGGEAETGPAAGGWTGPKFLTPAPDGAVLPILDLNNFKIANPTISASMTEEELTALYTGHGYAVRFVRFGPGLDRDMDAALAWAYDAIRAIQAPARAGQPPERPRWPMLILATPTC